ncbi:hypothetical protein T439DRAFT_208878 [Meredithblackwellia eburnea MCA 4105]
MNPSNFPLLDPILGIQFMDPNAPHHQQQPNHHHHHHHHQSRSLNQQQLPINYDAIYGEWVHSSLPPTSHSAHAQNASALGTTTSQNSNSPLIPAYTQNSSENNHQNNPHQLHHLLSTSAHPNPTANQNGVTTANPQSPNLPPQPTLQHQQNTRAFTPYGIGTQQYTDRLLDHVLLAQSQPQSSTAASSSAAAPLPSISSTNANPFDFANQTASAPASQQHNPALAALLDSRQQLPSLALSLGIPGFSTSASVATQDQLSGAADPLAALAPLSSSSSSNANSPLTPSVGNPALARSAPPSSLPLNSMGSASTSSSAHGAARPIAGRPRRSLATSSTSAPSPSTSSAGAGAGAGVSSANQNQSNSLTPAAPKSPTRKSPRSTAASVPQSVATTTAAAAAHDESSVPEAALHLLRLATTGGNGGGGGGPGSEKSSTTSGTTALTSGSTDATSFLNEDFFPPGPGRKNEANDDDVEGEDLDAEGEEVDVDAEGEGEGESDSTSLHSNVGFPAPSVASSSTTAATSSARGHRPARTQREMSASLQQQQLSRAGSEQPNLEMATKRRTSGRVRKSIIADPRALFDSDSDDGDSDDDSDDEVGLGRRQLLEKGKGKGRATEDGGDYDVSMMDDDDEVEDQPGGRGGKRATAKGKGRGKGKGGRASVGTPKSNNAGGGTPGGSGKKRATPSAAGDTPSGSTGAPKKPRLSTASTSSSVAGGTPRSAPRRPRRIAMPVNAPNRTFPPEVEINPTFSRFYRVFPVSSAFPPESYIHRLAVVDPSGLATGVTFMQPPAGSDWNKASDPLNLYSPRFVKGKGDEKSGLCPICVEPVSRGGEGVERWLKLKNSSYVYHMSYAHGLSNLTGLPFSPPIKTRTTQLTPATKDARDHMTDGLCHKCNGWIPLLSVKNVDAVVPELIWWKVRFASWFSFVLFK